MNAVSPQVTEKMHLEQARLHSVLYSAWCERLECSSRTLTEHWEEKMQISLSMSEGKEGRVIKTQSPCLMRKSILREKSGSGEDRMKRTCVRSGGPLLWNTYTQDARKKISHTCYE